MTDDEKITYSRAARFRVALSELAAEIADSARGMVPTGADNYAYGGDFAESASQLAAMARELLTLAVACERRRGVSWEKIGDGLSTSRQSAQERFGAAVGGLDDVLTAAWLRDDARYPGLPEGAASPAETAGRLDRWVLRHLEDTDPLAHEDGPGERPVSGHLEPMTTIEHMGLVTHGALLISERFGKMPDDPARWDAETRALEIGLARRKIELYERMRLESPASRLNGGIEVEDALAGARARLAELED